MVCRFLAARHAVVSGLFLLLLFAGGSVFAATPSKGLKIEPMLQQAIEESVPEPEPPPEPAPEAEAEMFGPPVPPPPPEPEKPIFPVYIEPEKEETRAAFRWPEKPGRKFNGMLFLPSLFLKQGWTDNLFTTDGNGESDLFTNLNPRLRVEIPEIRHDVTFDGGWEYRKYYSNSDEDQHNVDARFFGALNASNSISVPFDIRYAKFNEEREDDLTLQRSKTPLSIKDFGIEGGIQFKPNSFGLALLGIYQTKRNEDDRNFLTGAPIIRRDADHDVTELAFNTSFDLDPHNTLMLSGRTGERAYERRNFENGAFAGVRRDSDTFSGKLSWMFDYTGLKGHMSLGVADMNYDDSLISDIREIVGDMEIEHQIGDLTSINFQLARAVYEDEEVADPIIRSRAGLYLDRQFWDEILVAAGADFIFDEFNNTGRDDERWNFRLIADYFYNDFLSFGAEYGYALRDSEQAGLDFDRNIFMLRARGRL